MNSQTKNPLRTAAMLLIAVTALTIPAAAADRVKVSEGMIEGAGPQQRTGVRIFEVFFCAAAAR